MSKTTYNITLKGYVGGYDFDRATVDKTLAKNEGKEVNVLIDSLGVSLATGLSISAAFKNHGKVNVHFVGLNAFAATIASLGASSRNATTWKSQWVASPTTSTMNATDANCSCGITTWAQTVMCSDASDP